MTDTHETAARDEVLPDAAEGWASTGRPVFRFAGAIAAVALVLAAVAFTGLFNPRIEIVVEPPVAGNGVAPGHLRVLLHNRNRSGVTIESIAIAADPTYRHFDPVGKPLASRVTGGRRDLAVALPRDGNVTVTVAVSCSRAPRVGRITIEGVRAILTVIVRTRLGVRERIEERDVPVTGCDTVDP